MGEEMRHDDVQMSKWDKHAGEGSKQQ